MNGVVFVILGASGDLAKRQLIPSIYRLIKNKRIGKFAILGAARDDLKAKSILDASKKFMKGYDDKNFNILKKNFEYVQLDFYESSDYSKLKLSLDKLAKKGLKNRMFYFSTLPDHFDTITHYLDRYGVAKESKGSWARLVYEKPFGHDLKSAKKLNKCISRIFDEKQVYRIDHYLGKELVGNLAVMRFTNRFIEPLWNNEHVEAVEIIFDEDIGVEDRGAFYDKYGSLKDVVQNHMLQMLALVAMESPESLSGENIRDKKVEVLKKARIDDLILGQYKGYDKIKGVKKGSKTDTFSVVKISINNKRWRGVPFFLRTGKMLGKKKSDIHLRLKKSKCLFEHKCTLTNNYLDVKISPEEAISLEMNVRVPGKRDETIPVNVDFCHSCLFGPFTPEAYESLLMEVIAGDQSVFIRNDEIEVAWTLIDSIKKTKVYSYNKKSDGPKQLKAFNKKHDMRWKEE